MSLGKSGRNAKSKKREVNDTIIEGERAFFTHTIIANRATIIDSRGMDYRKALTVFTICRKIVKNRFVCIGANKTKRERETERERDREREERERERE